MPRSTLVLRLLLSVISAVALWLLCQQAIARVVGGVVVAAAAVCGERTYDVGGGRVAIVVGPSPGGGESSTRAYGVSLLRWHVNVIVVPILAMTIGAMTLPRRLLVALIGTALTLILDGLNVFLYLWLGVRRLRGTPVISPTFDGQLGYAIAVYGSKILPVLAWGIAYAVHGRERTDWEKPEDSG